MGYSAMHQSLVAGAILAVSCLYYVPSGVEAFQLTKGSLDVSRRAGNVRSLAAHQGATERERSFDPIGLAQEYNEKYIYSLWDKIDSKIFAPKTSNSIVGPVPLALSSVATWSAPETAYAEEFSVSRVAASSGLDPATFQPVCPTADGLYRILQRSAETVIGPENAREYAPLIAGGLLRVRLELCVVESFFNEAVGPFIERNGYSWILPLHETVESFIAGTVFALTATFILIGSTKIISVIVTYTDFLLGLPSRVFGGFFYDRALGKPLTLDVGLGPFKTRILGPSPEEEQEMKVNLVKAGPFNFIIIILSGTVKLCGQVLGVVRAFSDALDFFVGRYLVVWATGYVLIKFIHFKVFPNFP